MQENAMGFDLYGIAARSERGKYFRNNIWWWRPLADYVLARVDVPPSQRKDWETNSGQRVSGKTALRIAETLGKLIAEGETARYSREYKATLKALPPVQCETCKGTGERHDDVVDGKCNGCDGKGVRAAWATHYPFSVQNVREFAEFCRESGGFEIC